MILPVTWSRRRHSQLGLTCDVWVWERKNVPKSLWRRKAFAWIQFEFDQRINIVFIKRSDKSSCQIDGQVFFVLARDEGTVPPAWLQRVRHWQLRPVSFYVKGEHLVYGRTCLAMRTAAWCRSYVWNTGIVLRTYLTSGFRWSQTPLERVFSAHITVVKNPWISSQLPTGTSVAPIGYIR